MLSAQRNSGGHIRVYAGLVAPYDWHVTAGVDLDDAAAVRDHLLTVFDGWHDSLLDLIRESDGGFVNRPLHVLPAGHTWDHVPGVTLLGDAAHLMPPAGIGANLAMLDGADLAEAVVVHGGIDEAVRAYENRMLPRAAAGAQACADLIAGMSGDMVVGANSARRHLNERIRSAQPTG
ncbi:FAD-dependent oxidoreductase [Nonomuraea montanisoli]|uniref:FAD-dependent oxidoreductase n=1 Tax=Nonomuraea montanisoli TaxID=2741721 RepID=UPI001F273CBA|nr:FAD-dependent monooxygenase [Nonomuraea montanisoli]